MSMPEAINLNRPRIVDTGRLTEAELNSRLDQHFTPSRRHVTRLAIPPADEAPAPAEASTDVGHDEPLDDLATDVRKWGVRLLRLAIGFAVIGVLAVLL